ncbi:hypothetical protein TOK_2612 [Pseudonocardia sp. N23]|nr:hypothetical protein TOK_2612 [Pseudonocardia sp. N23]
MAHSEVLRLGGEHGVGHRPAGTAVREQLGDVLVDLVDGARVMPGTPMCPATSSMTLSSLPATSSCSAFMSRGGKNMSSRSA